MTNSSCSKPLADERRSHQRQASPTIKNKIKTALVTIAQTVAQIVHNQVIQGTEPVLSEHCDKNGKRYYRVYDPLHEKIHYFTTENEVRIWLDQRHYR